MENDIETGRRNNSTEHMSENIPTSATKTANNDEPIKQHNIPPPPALYPIITTKLNGEHNNSAAINVPLTNGSSRTDKNAISQGSEVETQSEEAINSVGNDESSTPSTVVNNSVHQKSPPPLVPIVLSPFSLKRRLHSDNAAVAETNGSPPSKLRCHLMSPIVDDIRIKSEPASPDECNREHVNPRIPSSSSSSSFTFPCEPDTVLPSALFESPPKRGAPPLEEPLKEYAQYLGLQPAVKFKCFNCLESNFASLVKLKDHQIVCLANNKQRAAENSCGSHGDNGGQQSHNTADTDAADGAAKTTTAPAAASSSSAAGMIDEMSDTISQKIRVTRKVFLCSACGTYYENWNLFLHMREVHRRHICLYCLRMFPSANRLALHLEQRHSIVDQRYDSHEQVLLVAKRAPLYLMCCTCEHIFTQHDNFAQHNCDNYFEPCTICGGVMGTHMPKCRCLVSSANSVSATDSSSSSRRRKSKKSGRDLVEHQELATPLPPPPPPPTTLPAIPLPPVPAPVFSQKSPLSEHESSPEPRLEIDESEPVLNVNQVLGIGTAQTTETIDKNTKKLMNDQATATVIGDNSILPNQQKSSENSQQLSSISNEASHRLDQQYENKVQKDNGDTVDVPETIDNQPELDQTPTSVENYSQIIDPPPDKPFSLKLKVKIPKEYPPPQSDEDDEEEEDEDEEEEEEEEEEDEDNDDDDDAEEEEEEEVKEDKEEEKSSTALKTDDDTVKQKEEPTSDTKSVANLGPETNAVTEIESKIKSEIGTEQLPSQSQSQVPLESDQNELSAPTEVPDNIVVANDDVQLFDLVIDQPLAEIDTCTFLRVCLHATIPFCLYCNHARKIAVNGHNLALHMISRHRFAATVNSITAEELLPQTIVARLRSSLDDLRSIYFNANTYDSANTNLWKIHDKSYECFQCRFITNIHKELYLHNRKLHLKSILLCIMCKSNFYSYSELLCHMCPGVYSEELFYDLMFRCCLCSLDRIPSAFRLMVHLRKKHYACDVCLEECHDQSRLSNHVWKHKLHHLCYRCGIAYRNKPDITKHLFWKHGTESVLCKRCLQKKWPHVYHFCIPPSVFACDVCQLTFSRAVALKVHKRLHSGDATYPCTEDNCEKKFISRKLLLKHVARHNAPPPPLVAAEIQPIAAAQEPLLVNGVLTASHELSTSVEASVAENSTGISGGKKVKKKKQKSKDKAKSLIDLIDLPAPNLSESDSSEESDGEKSTVAAENLVSIFKSEPELINEVDDVPELLKPTTAMAEIWENFKSYQASQCNRDNLNSIALEDDEKNSIEDLIDYTPMILHVVQSDHDYALMYRRLIKSVKILKDTTVKVKEEKPDVELKEKKNSEENSSTLKKQQRGTIATSHSLVLKKKDRHRSSSSSSDSSSGSGSSSCSCGSNCSCSSSSSGSSSSDSSSDDDDSEDSSTNSASRRRVAAERKERRRAAKLEAKKRNDSRTNVSETNVDVVTMEESGWTSPSHIDTLILESDLDTEESDTDEDFYDEHPQRMANELLVEKRAQLMAQTCNSNPMANYGILENSRPSTPSLPEEVVKEKRVKVKKRKKERKKSQPPLLAPVTIIATPLPPPQQPAPVAIVPPLRLNMELIAAATASYAASSRPAMIDRVRHSTGGSSCSDADNATAAGLKRSKRRRIPNKFYGYTSDDESTATLQHSQIAAAINAFKPQPPPNLTWCKDDLPSQPTPPIRTIIKLPQPSSHQQPQQQMQGQIQFQQQQQQHTFQQQLQQQTVPPMIIRPSGVFVQQPKVQSNILTPQPPPPLPSLPLPSSSSMVETLRVPAVPVHHINYNTTTPTFISNSRSPQPPLNQSLGVQHSVDKLKIRNVSKVDLSNNRSSNSGSSTKTTVAVNAVDNNCTTTDDDEDDDEENDNDNTIDDGDDDDDDDNDDDHDDAGDSEDHSRQLHIAEPYLSVPPSLPLPPQASVATKAVDAYQWRPPSGYPVMAPPAGVRRSPREGESVYCYCRCPYDEVSEMIACDGTKCRIEWFHFECVGILVPPKGKWYCPDCQLTSSVRRRSAAAAVHNADDDDDDDDTDGNGEKDYRIVG